MSTQYKEFIVNAGEYTGKVNRAEWVQSQYRKSQENPNGDSLSLWIDLELQNNKYKRVFDTISITDLLKINQARISAGLKEFRQSDVSDMENQRVLIEVERYKSKVGKVSNIVKSYLEQSDSFDNRDDNESQEIPF
mgnify:CR=1 FL=1